MRRLTFVAAIAVALWACKSEQINTITPPGYVVEVSLDQNFATGLIKGMEAVIDTAPGGPSLGFTASGETPVASEPVQITAQAKSVDGDSDVEFVYRFNPSPFIAEPLKYTFFLPAAPRATAPFSIRVNILSDRGVLATGVALQHSGGDPITLNLQDQRRVTVSVPCQVGVSCKGTVNRSPVLADIAGGTINVAVGQQLRIVLSAFDPDGDALTYSAELGAVPGATFDAGQQTFLWTPQAASATPQVVNFQVDDGRGGIDRKSVSILVVDAGSNSSPVWAPVTSRLVPEGQLLEIQLDVQDPDGDSLTVTLDKSDLPPINDASYDDAQRRFTWTPTFNDGRAEAYPVRFVADDGKGAQTTLTIPLLVSDVNRAPLLTAPTEITVQAGQAVALRVGANDADGDTVAVTLDASGLPPGNNASIDGALNFTWTPASSAVRSEPWVARFTADDGRGGVFIATVRFTVISGIGAPIVTAAPQTAVEGVELTFLLMAYGGPNISLTMDPDSFPARTSAQVGPETCPAGALPAPDACFLFKWTPRAGDARSTPYGVPFTAQYGSEPTPSSSVVVLITVEPPSISALAFRGPFNPDDGDASPVQVAGAALSEVKVHILDASGSQVPSATNAVTVSLVSPQGATLSGTKTVTAVGGLASFTDLSIDKVGSYQIKAEALGLTAGTSESFSVAPAAATRFEVTGISDPIVAGQAASVTVTAFDAFDNQASGYTGTVAFTSSDGAAVLPGSYTFVAGDAGAHTFSGLELRTVGSQTLTVTDTTNASVTGSHAAVTVNPAPAASLTVTGISSPATAGELLGGTVTAFDPFGNVASGYRGTITFSSSDSGAILPADYTFLASDNGVYGFTGLALTTTGTHSVSATDTVTASITGTQSGIEVTPSTAVSLRVEAIPGSIVAGTPATVTVTALDAESNVATGYRGTVNFTSTDGQAVLPSSYAFTASDNGTHSFSMGVELRTVATQSVTATDAAVGTITGTQSGIEVTPAAASILVVAGIASPTVAGTTKTVTVTARDPFGNVATGYTGIVAFTSSDTQAVLPSNYTFVAGDGGAKNLSVELRTAGAQSVTATDTVTGTITGTQSGITVDPADASSLEVGGFPTSTTAGVAGTFTVTARDPFNNVATGFRGTVAITSDDGQAVLPSAHPYAAGDNGTHDFSVELRTAGTRSLTATETSPGSLTASQTGISVTFATPNKLAFQVQPVNTNARLAIAPAIVVRVQDAFSNHVTDATNSVTLAFGNNPAPADAVLSGTLTRSASGGDATFNDIQVSLGGSGYTLTATSSGLASGTSAPFNIFHVSTVNRICSTMVRAGLSIAIHGADFDPTNPASNVVELGTGKIANVTEATRDRLVAVVPTGVTASDLTVKIGTETSNGVPFTVGPVQVAEASTVALPSFSADGRLLAFGSFVALSADDENASEDVYVYDRQTGMTQLVSIDDATGKAMGASYPSLSGDGRFVAFSGGGQIYVRDLGAGRTILVSANTAGAPGSGLSIKPSVSADGRYIAFESTAEDLVRNDTNTFKDIFVRDRVAGFTFRVSITTNEGQANDDSSDASISGDGTAVVFRSTATNLVGGDTNGVADVFIRNIARSRTRRLSLASDGTEGNSSSGAPRISADGLFIVFASGASNLVPGDTNNATDVFVRNRNAGITERVSLASDGSQADGRAPDISGDGRYITFSSESNSVVPGDNNGVVDLFVRDRQRGTTERVNVSADGAEANGGGLFEHVGALSANGEFVAFTSRASNLVAGDTGALDIDVFITSVSQVRCHGPQVVAASTDLARDGTEVVLAGYGFGAGASVTFGGLPGSVLQTSPLSMLVAAPAGVAAGAIVVSLAGESSQGLSYSLAPVRVSIAGNGTQGDADSKKPAIDATGQTIVYASRATNLVGNDTNLQEDIFVRNRPNNFTGRLSVRSNGTEGDSYSRCPHLSGDGRFAVFDSAATNLVNGDTNGFADVFARDRENDTTVRVSVSTAGVEGDFGATSDCPRVSASGRFVVFSSASTNLVAGDTNDEFDVFVRDMVMGTTERVNVSSGGVQATGGGFFGAFHPDISADGRYVVFDSGQTNLIGSDTNGAVDVFLRDRNLGVTVRASVRSAGGQADGASHDPRISANGRVVCFESEATNLIGVGNDQNGATDVYVRDFDASNTRRVSVSSSGEEANGSSGNCDLSADGRFVVFDSRATNLAPGDTSSVTDVFVHDRVTGKTSQLSVTASGEQANGVSRNPAISDDGRIVAFETDASNLIGTDSNGAFDIYITTVSP